MEKIKNNGLKLFVWIVIGLSIICDFFIISKGTEILYLLLMWIPALAAFISNIYESFNSNEKFNVKNFFKNLGFRLCSVKYILLSILIPLIYLLIPYIIHWIIYPDDFAYNGVSIILILKDCLLILFLGTFVGLFSALGEEIGWRGYFVPRLNELYGEKKALIFSSLFWCLWHLPLIIGGAYLSDIPLYYQVPMFIVCIFPVGIICGFLSLKTNSVWPSAFLHSAHNNYDQGVFQLITRGKYMFYLVSETGIFTAICVWAIVFGSIIINKRKK